MNGETAFFALLLGIPCVAFVGIGLVISAFAGGKRKLTKAAIVRAIVGGVLTVFCTAAYLVFLK